MKVLTKRAFNAQIKRISAESGTPVPTPSKGTWEKLRKSGMSPEAALIKVINAARVPFKFRISIEIKGGGTETFISLPQAEYLLGKKKLKEMMDDKDVGDIDGVRHTLTKGLTVIVYKS